MIRTIDFLVAKSVKRYESRQALSIFFLFSFRLKQRFFSLHVINLHVAILTSIDS